MQGLLRDGGAVRLFLDELRATVSAVRATNDPSFGSTGVRLAEAVESLTRATDWLLTKVGAAPDEALAGATPYLRLFGIASGGCALAEEALAAVRLSPAGEANAPERIATARFFAENIAVGARGLETTVTEGGAAVAAGTLEISA